MTIVFSRRGACPALSAPMQTGDGLLVRLNPVAGGFAPNALIGLCESALKHGNGIVEVTARGSLQIRGLTPESAPLLAADVDALGISVRSGVPVETGPLAGLDPDEIADPRPLADAIRAAIAEVGLSDRLGPKVSVVVDGGGRTTMAEVMADVRLAAHRMAGDVMWHLAMSDSATTATPLGLLSHVAARNAVLAVLQAVATQGRDARARDVEAASLSYLSGGRSAGEALWGGEPTKISTANGERSKAASVAIFPLRDGTHALGVALPFGSMLAEKIVAIAEKALALGIGEIRLAPRRALHFLGPDADACRQLQSHAAVLGFVTEPADPRVAIAACPGRPACASGSIATRDIAAGIATTDADLLDGSFTLHVSGCAKGCAHPGHAALTLVGDEKGAGPVVDGTAKSCPTGVVPYRQAAHGLGRIAALVRKTRRSNETVAACLTRLGGTKITAAFAQE